MGLVRISTVGKLGLWIDAAKAAGYISQQLTHRSVKNMPTASPSPAEPTAPRRVRRKEARPGELLDAALSLFVEKGYAATKVEQVAARAGVSKGTLFLYFPSKEALFKAVVRADITARFAAWNEEFEHFQGSTTDMLRYCYSSWWEHIGSTRASGIIKLVLSEASNFPEITQFYQHEVTAPGQELIRRVLQRGMDGGEFRQLDLDYAVYAVLAPMMFLTFCKHSPGACLPASQAFSPQTYLDAQLDILLQGLRALPQPVTPTLISPDF